MLGYFFSNVPIFTVPDSGFDVSGVDRDRISYDKEAMYVVEMCFAGIPRASHRDRSESVSDVSITELSVTGIACCNISISYVLMCARETGHKHSDVE